MTEEFVINIAQTAVFTVLLVSSPMLGLALIVGLAIGIFQAVTSINEMTLTFIPKIVIVIVSLVVFAPWILQVMQLFTEELFRSIQLIAH
ncbi:flagellar biosynthesis protein FliQ [candidate division KSB1 bacterium]|nr:flagellar biosynthesis protein FliQ [candidate division KSB1 bacterium]